MSPAHCAPPATATTGGEHGRTLEESAQPPGSVSCAEMASPRRFLSSVSTLVLSQALMGIAGLVSLPVLARNLGPGGYGELSIFLTLIGVVSYQDFIRPLLIRQGRTEAGSDGERDFGALSVSSTWVLGLLAAAAGFACFDPATALAFTLAVVFHGLASTDYARLAVDGRVDVAGGIRNLAWAAAALVMAGLSFELAGPDVYAWPLLGASGAIWLAYRFLAGRIRRSPAGAKTDVRASLAGALPWSAPARAAWKRHGREIRDLLGFSIAVGVMVSADRLILQDRGSRAELGLYVACADMALKLTILGSALGMVLYPIFARSVKEEGVDVAAQRFLRACSWILPAFFALVAALCFLDRPLVRLVLGPQYLPAHGLFTLVAAGVFVQMFGFLITPWQRARGDFATQRRAYGLSAALMVAVGLVLIPRLGPLGAALAWLTSRSAEVLLVASEIRALPRRALPVWKIALASSMAAVLLLLASIRGSGHFG